MGGGINAPRQSAHHRKAGFGYLVGQPLRLRQPVVRCPARSHNRQSLRILGFQRAANVQAQRRVVYALQRRGVFDIQWCDQPGAKPGGGRLLPPGIQSLPLRNDIVRHLDPDASHGRQNVRRRGQHRLGRPQGFAQGPHPHRTDSLDLVQQNVGLP